MDLRTMTNREEGKTFWMIPELVEILLSFLGSRVHPDPCLGTGDGTKTDEFSEKFQTASDLPPFIFRNLCCKIVFYSLYFLRFSVISEIYPSQRGAATEIKC